MKDTTWADAEKYEDVEMEDAGKLGTNPELEGFVFNSEMETSITEGRSFEVDNELKAIGSVKSAVLVGGKEGRNGAHGPEVQPKPGLFSPTAKKVKEHENVATGPAPAVHDVVMKEDVEVMLDAEATKTSKTLAFDVAENKEERKDDIQGRNDTMAGPEGTPATKDSTVVEGYALVNDTDCGNVEFTFTPRKQWLPEQPTPEASISEGFDMKLLQSRIKDGNAVLDKVQGKDVVLVVGKTGVGKSLFLQGIAGKKIVAVSHLTTYLGKTSSVQVFEAQNPLSEFKVGHDKVSQTSSINCLVRQGVGPNKEDIIYIDNPGWEDTGGCEVDIASSVMISQVIQKARSSKLVVLINYASLLQDRGGAIRDVLKVAHAFVPDFEKYKLSFMFLFTHTHNATIDSPGLTVSLDATRQRIEQEVLCILKETKDVEVQSILGFMYECLVNKYPFVDVMHPLMSNFEEIAKFIERKLRPIPTPDSSSNYGLTTKSQLLLERQIQVLLSTLRRLFHQLQFGQSFDSVVEELQEAREAIKYFFLHVRVPGVEDTYNKCDELFRHHVDKHRLIIDDTLKKATADGSHFGSGHVKAIKQSLSQVEVLSPVGENHNSLAGYYLKTIFSKVVEVSYSKVMKVPDLEGLEQSLEELGKLKSWSEGFDCFKETYRNACLGLQTQVKTLANGMSVQNPEDLGNLSREGISTYMKRINTLGTVQQSDKVFSLHNIDISPCVQIIPTLKSNLVDMASKWGTTYDDANAMREMQAQDDILHERLLLCAKRADKLETWHTEIVAQLEKNLYHDVAAAIETSLEKLKEFAVLQYGQSCDQFRSILRDNSGDAEQHFKHLHNIHTLCAAMPKSRWCSVSRLYGEIFEEVKSKLETELVEIREIANQCRQFGLSDGVKDAERLLGYHSFKWFDGYSNGPNSSVVSRLGDTIVAYRSRLQEIIEAGKRSSSGLKFLSQENSGRLRECHEVFSKIEQFKIFEEKRGGDPQVVTNMHRDAFEGLRNYQAELCTNTAQLCTEWRDCLKEKDTDAARELTEKLDCLLKELEAIESFHVLRALKKEAKHAQQHIHGYFKSVNEAVEKDFNAPDDYHKKASHLECIIAITGFSHTDRLIPDIKVYKEKARVMIKKRARELEQLVTESADSGSIKACMKSLEDAKALDSYTDNEATKFWSEFQSLQNPDAKDQQLQEMFNNGDFVSLRKFLESLKASWNPFNWKFNSCSSKVWELLQVEIAATKAMLAHPSEEGITHFMETMKLLRSANKEIGRLLKGNGFNIAREIDGLKSEASMRLSTLADSVLDGSITDDFFKMGTKLHICTMLYCDLADLLSYPAKKRYRDAESKWEAAKELIPMLVEKFASSSFRESRRLLAVIRSLDAASKSEYREFSDMHELYESTISNLTQTVHAHLHRTKEVVQQTGAYGDGIVVVENLNKSDALELQSFMKPFQFDSSALLKEWKEELAKLYNLVASGPCSDEILYEYKTRMDKLKAAFVESRFPWDTQHTYQGLQQHLKGKVMQEFERCQRLVEKEEILSSRRSFDIAIQLTKELQDHISDPTSKRRELEDQTVKKFIDVCKKAVQCLTTNNMIGFKVNFPEMRLFALHFPFILRRAEAKKEFSLVNQLVYDALKKGVDNFHEAISNHDYKKVRSHVKFNRTHCAFLADHYSLFFEELKQGGEFDEKDEWLCRIWELICESFSCGRDVINIKSYAILGILPSASEDEIRKAYKRKALQVHPGKQGGSADDPGQDFRRLKDAHDYLLATFQSRTKSDTEQLCDSSLHDIPSDIKRAVKECMKNQQYDRLELLLESLTDFEIVCNLVNPKMDYEPIRDSIIQLVRDCVHGIRTQVNTTWNERNYKLLNENITDLKQMEASFKSFPEVFPTSWNQGIIKSVESEIESLGKKARSYLRDKTTATSCIDDFRRCFIQMGSVLVELQMFREFTKDVMYSILESCLQSDWGYSYLFELGLSLHRDKSGNDDDVRIGQTILSEFSHFKEVMTMVWNEETIQKDADLTIQDIRGERRQLNSKKVAELRIEKDILLASYYSFESEYNKLLYESLKPGSDRGKLARKTKMMAKDLQPLTCGHGWNGTVKAQLPKILAGVFALFTIAKSGDSYNRIQETSGTQVIGDKILMKPHNIQVLTILYLLGCGKVDVSGLESQLMQIRTGEGKSMILGATAAVLGLLGFKVRCVCYSDYLSNRDYLLFGPVFKKLGLVGLVIYSKITTLSEDTTQAKGDLRGLTQQLLHQNLVKRKSINQEVTSGQVGGVGAVTSQTSSDLSATVETSQPEEILLVDEVDVFFGKEFYGQTYNQVTEERRPEIAEILTNIWKHHQNGQKQKLADIRKSSAYVSLVADMPNFKFLIDNEIRLMLDHVERVEEEPYFLHPEHDKIGYKVFDTISYQVTYGYRTVFAYLKEASNGNLKDRTATLNRVLVMQVSCGQFSYANLNPTRTLGPSRILGVSGTLESMGSQEKNVLMQYGVENYVFVPSVYGKSNFDYDKAGDGIYIESNETDFFQRITEEAVNRVRKKRAVIVFFKDNQILEKYKSSLFFPKLGRHKAVLLENMESSEKDFAIKKAATAGQVTLCPAVFGRGTDFFCKDENVQQGGGVHIIQTFLSAETSEEVQIQGRTSRQGKKGSYQLVLLEKDLCDNFGVAVGEKDSGARNERYEWLCQVREKQQMEHWKAVEENLKDATRRDVATHKYFDALLQGKQIEATKLFEDLYWMVKKPPIPESITIDIACLIDITGSMTPYCKHAISTIQGLVDGNNSILSKLTPAFPDTKLTLRMGAMGYRDIDDGRLQFNEGVWDGGEHFTESMTDVITFVDKVTKQPSGGNDLAEDHLGAIHRCMKWGGQSDWSSTIKMILLFTDAPAHGFIPPASSTVPNVDGYAIRHPKRLTASSICDELVSNDATLLVCSYNPGATFVMEEKLSQVLLNHPKNSNQREVTRISMVPQGSGNFLSKAGQSLIGDHPNHIVFVLDESGSMQYDWPGVVRSFKEYIAKRRQNQNDSDLVSVVQFDSNVRVTMQKKHIVSAEENLGYRGGGTQFAPAALEASRLVSATPTSHKPTVVFMSDGETNDSTQAASTFTALNQQVKGKHGCDLELHVIAFGGGADARQLQEIARSSPNGRVHLSSDTMALTKVFVDIAGGQDIATALQGEISKEISEAVTDTLCLEYLS